MNKDNYHEQGNIIIMLLLLPLGHISNNDIEIRKAHTDLKGSDPLTKTSLTSNMIKHKTH